MLTANILTHTTPIIIFDILFKNYGYLITDSIVLYMNMKNDDLKNAPKLFCESISIGKSAEYFVLGLSSGSQAHIFTLTPGHAKRLQQYLSYELAEFEKEYGVLDTTWEPLIKSPVQRANPPSEKS